MPATAPLSANMLVLAGLDQKEELKILKNKGNRNREE